MRPPRTQVLPQSIRAETGVSPSALSSAPHPSPCPPAWRLVGRRPLVPVARPGPARGTPPSTCCDQGRGAPLTRGAPTGVQTACGSPDTEMSLPWGLGLWTAQLSPRAAGRWSPEGELWPGTQANSTGVPGTGRGRGSRDQCGAGRGSQQRGAMWGWGRGPRSLCLQTGGQRPHSPPPRLHPQAHPHLIPSMHSRMPPAPLLQKPPALSG